MISLSDRKWSAFKITDIFTLSLSSGDNQLKMLETGNFPLVSSGSTSNGVVGFIKDGDGKSQLFNKGKITVDMFGKAFVHDYSFFSVSHGRINILTPKYNANLALNIFMAKAIENSTKNKFSYNVMCSQDRLARSLISLPVDDNRNLDFDFMENYIKERIVFKRKDYIEYAKRQLAQIERERERERVDSVVKWLEFRIEDLFEIKSGKRLVKSNIKSGNRPFIGASDSNNGITMWCSNINGTLDHNVLGVNYNGSVVENFYHPYECIFSDDVKRFHLKEVVGDKYLYLFIKTSIIKQKVKYRYAYKFNEKRMRRQTIILPATDDERPNYEYMSAIGKDIMARKYTEYLSYANQP